MEWRSRAGSTTAAALHFVARSSQPGREARRPVSSSPNRSGAIQFQ
jgi:hypothetical protein